MQSSSKLIHNVLDEEKYNALYYTLSGAKFPWFYNSSSYQGSKESIKSIGNIVDYPQFSHKVFDNNEIISPVFKYILPVIKTISHKKLIRVKVNLNVFDKNSKIDSYGIPHVDTVESDAVTAIYYLNDSDGDTYLFNEQHAEDIPFDKMTIKEKVTPVKNSLLMFPAATLHSGSTPRKSNRRIVININFIPE
jgi:hypothetical protein